MKQNKDMLKQKVLILDTTLRDGEQTSGVSFTETEKLSLAKILLAIIYFLSLSLPSTTAPFSSENKFGTAPI